MSLLNLVPDGPSWRVDWKAMQEFDWIRALAGCRQDPEWHAEGDVWTHTRMTLEVLVALVAWRTLPSDERTVVFLACMLHDASKPVRTRLEPDGHIVSPGHSRHGAIRARQILWEDAIPFALREQVCGLIHHHQIPFFAVDRKDAERIAVGVSQIVRPDLLSLVSEADARGRICLDQQRLLDNIALWSELCRELQCLDAPYRFPSDHARFLYFRDVRRTVHTPAWDDTRNLVIIMSGLPGAGKDRWIREKMGDVPIISLDDIREKLDILPGKPQGRVIQEARERAKVFLRAGQPFVWNATNVSIEMRGRILNLCADYKAYIRIVYVESTHARIWDQNRRRDRAVPEAVMDRLIGRWTVPSPTEAHEICFEVEDSPK